MSQYNETRFFEQGKETTTRKHWHLARHVVRSGLIIHRPRRASDSILPLLKRTQQTRIRTDSVDSNQNSTPFQSLVDYLSKNDQTDANTIDSLLVPNRVKRSASDSTSCTHRNQLDDSISQYERILRHLKNYEQFMADYSISPTPVTSSLTRRQSLNQELAPRISETREPSLGITSRKSSQTQSLSSRVGRTFTDFVINDLFLPTPPKVSPTEPHENVFSAPATPTEVLESTNDFTEIVPTDPTVRKESMTNEEADVALNELDTILENALPLTPNSPVHVIVVNSAESVENEPVRANHVRHRSSCPSYRSVFRQWYQLNHWCSVYSKAKRHHSLSLIWIWNPYNYVREKPTNDTALLVLYSSSRRHDQSSWTRQEEMSQGIRRSSRMYRSARWRRFPFLHLLFDSTQQRWAKSAVDDTNRMFDCFVSPMNGSTT